MLIVYGAKYQADLSVPFVATNSMVEDKLQELGLVNPESKGWGSSRVVTGIWGKPTQDIELPPSITNVRLIG